MFSLIYRKYGHRLYFKDDVLSGLTVALALVPEAVAFAFVAGIDPIIGLYAAFMVGLITAIFGGRPGMISGATGALAVVMVDLIADHGIEYLFPTVILMGILQIGAGLLRLGKFIRLVPHPVMFGFVNGLAIVIFLAQKPQFTTNPTVPGSPWMQGTDLYLMLGLVILTMIIIQWLPKITKAIPSALAAIITVTFIAIGIEHYCGIHLRTVGDLTPNGISGSLPTFHSITIPFSLASFKIIAPYAFILAAIGLIESLMTMSLIDELTETRGQGNRECVGQGLANVVTGFFGGMGGCAMIGQSMINIRSGGRGRLSGITAAVCLLAFILWASSLIEIIPMAALTGVMFMVVFGTFEWTSFRILHKIPKPDAFVILLVSIVTVWTDLAIAVASGVVFSALSFAWQSAKHINIIAQKDEGDTKIYNVYGPLFFGSVQEFQNSFSPKTESDKVIIDFKDSRVWDHSGIEAINALAERFKNADKDLHIRHLSEDCRRLLDKAQNMIEVNIVEDPSYKVAIDT